ncbi:hypothetical protein CDA63_01605 [Hymenobacter amundsenii]|uniref:Uncharacterized protein n=1 Tax=Hymenobacter amundsenii TaxID=2006685 RepID=A0A246FQS3_9BACT|nr:hypothetical protein [Hymenobacter amundsenii]OWP65077.1 hypothetical protein CDA63_01605 [Hymenobacter amundsenii]
MMLLIKASQDYPHRPLPPAPYLLEAPRAATAALEAAIRACPQNDFTADYPRPTPTQRYELGIVLQSPYLTHREFVWIELWRYELDTDTAAQVLTQLQHIIAHRKASGVAPVPYKGSCFFPERYMPPQP